MQDGERRAARPTPYAVALLVVVSLLPFIGFLDQNRDEPLPVLRVLGYGLLVAALAVGAELVGLRLVRRADPDRLAVAIGVVVFSFFSFARWLEPRPREGQEAIQIVLWVVITAAFAALLYRMAGSPALRQWLLATVAIWAGIVGVSYGQYTVTHRSASVLARGDDADVQPGDAVERPNVYLFLLDFYAANDVIADRVGVDNSAFHDDLAERGFVVAEHALASYPVTTLSTMSTFEMGYPASEPAQYADGIEGFTRYIRGDNSTVEHFHQLGYEYVYSPNGVFSFSRCTERFADHCIAPDASGATLGDVELELLDLTPLGSLGLFRPPRTDPGYVLDQLEQIDDLAAPFFLFAHIMSPHPPYRYREDCSLRDQGVERLTLTPEEEQRQYATEIRCLDADVLAAVDRIVERDPDAVILLQSDHGSEFLSNWLAPLDQWSDDALIERYGVQDAFRLPERCRDMVRDDTALVNTFRIVFVCLEGREPELVPYRGFLWRWGDRENIVEIPPERLGAAG